MLEWTDSDDAGIVDQDTILPADRSLATAA